MKKFLLLLLLGVMAVATVAESQETVPSPGSYFPQPGNRKLDGNVWISGQLYRGTAQTDWVQWFPATRHCAGYESGGTYLTPIRVAQFDWGLRGAASKTWDIVCSLDLPTRTATSAGAKITSIDLVYGVTGANLTSNTFQGIRTVTYASDTLNAIATFGGTITTGTMQTVSQVTPYLTSSSFGTPAFVNVARRAVLVEWTMVTASSSLATVYGVAVHFSRAD